MLRKPIPAIQARADWTIYCALIHKNYAAESCYLTVPCEKSGRQKRIVTIEFAHSRNVELVQYCLVD